MKEKAKQKYFSKILLVFVCIILLLEGCKSVASCLKKEEYQEAYELCEKISNIEKKKEKKKEVIDEMLKKNKYVEAYHLANDSDIRERIIDVAYKNKVYHLANDSDIRERIINVAYKNKAFDEIYDVVKSNTYEKNKFIDRMLDDNNIIKCYEVIDDESSFDYLADRLVNKKIFIKTPDINKNNESLKMHKYNYLSIIVKKCIEHYYNDYRFKSNSKSEAKTNKIRAINNIRNIYIFMKHSEYKDDNFTESEAILSITGAKINGRICITTKDNIYFDVQEIVNNPFVRGKPGINDYFKGKTDEDVNWFSYGGSLLGYDYWSDLKNYIDESWIESLKESMINDINNS